MQSESKGLPFRVVSTAEDIASAVRESSTICSVSSGMRHWRTPSRISLEPEVAADDLLDGFPRAAERPMALRFWGGREVSHSPADQVVTATRQTSLHSLQKALAEHGQCLPVAASGSCRFFRCAGLSSLGNLIEFNLPHALEAQCGSWRDWVLGMTVVLADGTVAKSGSHAVKNVAGYDVHKLMIGARATLAIVAEVILRTYPLAALPKPEVQLNYEWRGWRESSHLLGIPLWLQRTKHSDFAAAVKGAGGTLLEADWASATLCAHVAPDRELDRFPGDWVLRSRAGAGNLVFSEPAEIRLMKRAKEVFDPGGKLNPGEMGIF